MKNIRRFLFCGLAAAVCCTLSGCATTYGYYEEQMRARDEKAARDQLTFCEKAGSYCGQCLQAVLYGMCSQGNR